MTHYKKLAVFGLTNLTQPKAKISFDNWIQQLKV